MSQTLSVPMAAPRPARRSVQMPAPVAIVAAVLLAAAHMPLLLAHLHALMLKPHYEFFPLVFLGAAVLAWPAWDSVRAWASSAPNRRGEILAVLIGIDVVLWILPDALLRLGIPVPAWLESAWLTFLVAVVLARAAWDLARATDSPAPAGRLAGLALLGLNLILLATAIALDSPWLGMISFWELLVATAVLAGGWKLLRVALPALIFLLLLVPPPLNLDGKLVLGLQGLTSKVSSRVLDRIELLHYLDGNTFEVGTKKYLVEKACSGINSLFSTLAVSLFCVLYFGAHWLRATLLFVAAVFWVVVANVTRVSLIVWMDNRFGFDLSKDGFDWEKGNVYQHTILGFVLFGLILALMYSTNRLLMFIGTAVRWGDAAPVKPDELQPSLDSPAPRSVGWGLLVPTIAAYGLLVVFQAGEMGLGAAVTESSIVKSYNQWAEDSLPEQIGAWPRQKGSTFESRDSNNPYGAHSRTWKYKNKNGLTAIISFDYPFPEWHDLRYCYTGIGWRMVDSAEFRANDGDSKLECVRFDLAKDNERLRGYGWFTEFDQSGQPISVRAADLSKTYVDLRWKDRFTSIRDRWLSLFGQAKAPPSFMDVLQVQVLVENFGPMPQEMRDQAEKFFLQATGLIRAKCLAAATVQPAQ